jgi:hypothetical protein
VDFSNISWDFENKRRGLPGRNGRVFINENVGSLCFQEGKTTLGPNIFLSGVKNSVFISIRTSDDGSNYQCWDHLPCFGLFW